MEGNGASYIYDDALVMIYLHAGEFWWDYYPRQKTMLCIRPNGSNVKVIPSYKCRQIDEWGLFSAYNNVRVLWSWFMKSSTILGSNRHTILVARDATTSSTICFSVYGVWLSLCIIQCTYTSITTFVDYGARLLLKFGFCQPIKFDSLT
jgi:hypothetical protein